MNKEIMIVWIIYMQIKKLINEFGLYKLTRRI